MKSVKRKKLHNSVKKFSKNLNYILRWTEFLIIPFTTLYCEYIDRPKLTKQKPVEHIVPPPLKRIRINKL